MKRNLIFNCIGLILIFLSFSACEKENELIYGTVKDVEGNIYKTIQIGTQTWMGENLKTTKYNDGTDIPNVTDTLTWIGLTTPGFCWYGNDLVNKSIYGALYNWHTVNTSKLAPIGWHVPTDAEWTILTDFLGGKSVAGGKLKEEGFAHWISPNTDGSNSIGFSALPGGYRRGDGTFSKIASYGYWWSSSEGLTLKAWHRSVYYHSGNMSRYDDYSKVCGFSVRCVKD